MPELPADLDLAEMIRDLKATAAPDRHIKAEGKKLTSSPRLKPGDSDAFVSARLPSRGRWFLFHGQADAEVSTGCHRMSCGEYVLGRVHVGVIRVSAAGAYKDGLALARLRIHPAATAARLRRVRGGDFLHLRPGVPGRADQGEFEAVPTLVQDGAVQAGLLLHIPSGRLDGSGGASGHVPGLEVFQDDHAVPVRQCVGGLFAEVLAPVGGTGVVPGQGYAHLGAIVRSALGPCEGLLEAALPLVFSGRGELPVVELAVAGRNGDLHPAVDTDSHSRGVAFATDLAVLNKQRHVPESGLERHGGRSNRSAYRTGPAEPDPAQLRQFQPAPLATQSLDPDEAGVGEPEGRRPARLGTPVDFEGAVGAACLVQVHQGLLEAAGWGFGKPWEIGFGLGHFAGLRHVVYPRPAAPVLTALFQSGVPYRAACVCGGFGQRCLFGGEVQPVSAAGQHQTCSRRAPKRCVSRAKNMRPVYSKQLSDVAECGLQSTAEAKGPRLGFLIGDAHGRTYALAAKEQVDDAKADAQRWQELNAELRRQMKPLTRHTYAHTALEKRLHELAAEAKRRGEGVPVEELLAAIDDARAVALAKWDREQAQARQQEGADA